ncbi:isochorismatase family protein [bacterium]|nr:isochorismatase family protein [bacterium]
MNILNQDNTLFLVIDIQEKLINATFNKEIILRNSHILAKVATILNIPTIITEQYPKGLGRTISEIKTSLINHATYEKVDFNAFADLFIKESVKSQNKINIVLFGIETHICVYQTAKALLEDGYNVIIIKDSCGSRSEFEYNNGLDNLRCVGADIKTTEMVIFELLKTAKHPNFKEIQALIK